MRRTLGIVSCIAVIATLAAGMVWAQADPRLERAAKWNNYSFAAGDFVRREDSQKGISLWLPSDWKETPDPRGFSTFAGNTPSPRILALTEDFPEGAGVAAYTSAFLQQLRTASVIEDTVLVRPVLVAGTAGREITLDLTAPNGAVAKETIWIAVAGPRAYVFLLVTAADTYEQDEQLFKRAMLSLRIGAAGHWDSEYEKVRSQFVGSQPAAESEVEASLLAEQLRGAKVTAGEGARRLAPMWSTSPGAVLDLLTDVDPQVRTAAILALDKLESARADGPLAWALEDPDAHSSVAAAAALVKRRAEMNGVLQQRLDSLSIHPESLIRLCAMMKESDAESLTTQLLASDNARRRAAGLDIAIALHLPGLKIPFLDFLENGDADTATRTVEALAVMRESGLTPEILKLLGSNSELRAARALGEVAPKEMAVKLESRIDTIDKRLGELMAAPKITGGPAKAAPKERASRRAGSPPTLQPSPTKPPQEDKASTTPPGEVSGLTGTISTESGIWTMTPEAYGKQPEISRLAYLRGELDLAREKILARSRWEAAKDRDSRDAVREETKKRAGMTDWAESRLRESPEESRAVGIQPEKLIDAPTTGETLFPASTSLYLMAPNIEEGLAKIDDALSGIQMESVRDQTLFVLVLKSFKARSAAKLNAESDASAAIGLDLRKPLAVAAWPGAQADSPLRSALVAKVSDSDRFERSAALYLSEVGDFDSFATSAAAAVRLAGAFPAVIPAGLALASNPALAKYQEPKPKVTSTHVFITHELAGQQPIVVIRKLTRYASGVTAEQSLFLTYLGSTAVLAPTRASLDDILAASAGRVSFAQSAGFASLRSEHGEVVFFSKAGELFRTALKDTKQDLFLTLADKIGIETGSLQVTPKSWQTDFHLKVADGDLTKYIREVAPAELTAPRELLPAQTLLYAGGIVDAAGAWRALRSAASQAKHDEAASASVSITDEEIESSIIPHLQGEMGFAVTEILPALLGDATDASTVFFFKLKDGELARQAREGKLFRSAAAMDDLKVFGEPVFAVGNSLGTIEGYAAATDHWLVITPTSGSLKSLENSGKLAETKDYARTLATSPSKHFLFLTFNLEAALDEAQQKFPADETGQNFRSVMYATTHAFHSQHAFVSSGDGQLNGEMAVSFDREGRYSVGELEKSSPAMDVTNAEITPRGVRIAQPSRVEQLRLRLRSKLPGFIGRIREDIRESASEHIENATDNELVFSTLARHIPKGRTIELPVKSPELEPYLRADARIRSTAPEIVSLAKQIAGDDHDGLSVARKLGEWTYKNLKWKKVESDAVETLAKREADCLEHSELYVSLARALGLPARVVFGLAYGRGSFGGHAWVEIYLGEWVEVDPTWGSMDSVDASHLRFSLDTVSSLAFLGQMEMDVLGVRGFITDEQRDPSRLVHALGESTANSPAAYAYDVQLAADASLGSGAFDKLDDKQRTAVVSAFDHAVASDLSEWREQWSGLPRVLTQTGEGDRTRLVVLRGSSLLRVSLAKRDGGWFVTEVENMDSGISLFGSAFDAALRGGAPLGKIEAMQSAPALKEIDKWIGGQGESPALLLLQSQHIAIAEVEGEENKKEKPASSTAPDPDAILRKVIAKWPDFAPAYRELANNLLGDESHAGEGMALLEKYTSLVPFDPRPWGTLAAEYEKKKRFADSERALREFIRLDPGNAGAYVKLAAFLAARERSEDAAKSLAAAFEHRGAGAGLFNSLNSAVRFSERPKEEQNRFIKVVLDFTAELEKDANGLRLLAHCQNESGLHAEAAGTIKRLPAGQILSWDYSSMASYLRAGRDYQAALDAAGKSVKLDESSAQAYFERACALAQLGRKQEALEAIKKAIELDEEDEEIDLEDADLKPISSMPEFKALLEKRGKGSTSEAQEELVPIDAVRDATIRRYSIGQASQIPGRESGLYSALHGLPAGRDEAFPCGTARL